MARPIRIVTKYCARICTYANNGMRNVACNRTKYRAQKVSGSRLLIYEPREIR